MSAVVSRTRPTVLFRLLASICVRRQSDSSRATMFDTLMLSGSVGRALDNVRETELFCRGSTGLVSRCCWQNLFSKHATISTTETFGSSPSPTVSALPPSADLGLQSRCFQYGLWVLRSHKTFWWLPKLRWRLARPFSSQVTFDFLTRNSPNKPSSLSQVTPGEGVLLPLDHRPSEPNMAILSRTCPGLMTAQISRGSTSAVAVTLLPFVELLWWNASEEMTLGWR